jgi:hypothetical protein
LARSAALTLGHPVARSREEFFTLFSEAGSNIVESVAIPLAARTGSAITAVAV